MSRPNSRAAVAFLLIAPVSIAFGVDYDETLNGELSDDQFAPTSLGVLGEGAHTVAGSTTSAAPDRDFFTFEIAPGTALASIILSAYSGPPAGGGSFLAVEDGFGFSTLDDATGYLGTALVGRIPGSTQGEDVLDELGNAILGGSGFSGALGPGTYTLWYQETGDSTDYEFTLNVTPAPSAMGLMGLAGIAAMRRRRA